MKPRAKIIACNCFNARRLTGIKIIAHNNCTRNHGFMHSILNHGIVCNYCMQLF